MVVRKRREERSGCGGTWTGDFEVVLLHVVVVKER